MKTTVILLAITTLLILFTDWHFPKDYITPDDLPVIGPQQSKNKTENISDKNPKIKFNFKYDASSIKKIISSPEEVIEDVSAFWENENAYRLMKSWHQYNDIPIDYEGWKKNIEKITTIPISKRRDNPDYTLVNEIIGAKETFIKKAIPHICSFLPKKELTINSTAYFVAFTYPRGIGVNDRIVIDIFNSYFRRNSSMILNTMVHELYHTGFGHIQFASTDPEFESSAIRRMLSDFQNEGITTYVAYKAQDLFPAPYEEDYSMLENNKIVYKLILRLNKLFKKSESMTADALQEESWELGVDKRAYYIVGAFMARTIDEKLGREELNMTIEKGPLTFIKSYNAIADKIMQIHEIKPPANPSIFERLRQTAVNQDYNTFGVFLSEIKENKSEIDRSKEDTFLRIGLVFMQQKRNDLAIEICRFNSELFPNSAAGYNFLGMAHRQKGNKVSALENFKKAIELDPEYVDAVENLKNLQK